MIKNYFKDWNTFEKTYVILSFMLIIATNILANGTIITTLYNICYIAGAILAAKGKVENYIFWFVGVFIYSIISFNQHYYGEIIINIVISLPLMIIGIIDWLKHKDDVNNSIVINNLSIKEISIVLLSQFIMFFGYYYLLKFFNTEELIISSLSIVASVLAMYFEARRSELCYYSYLTNDVIILSLWLIPVIKGNTMLLSVVICPTLLFINDIYGVYNWKRLKKIQNVEDKNE